MIDHLKLFVGAAVQWGFGTAFTRFAVLDGNPAVFGTVFAAQSIWWLNIHQTTRDTKWTRWLAWSLGAACGALVGKWLS